MTYDTHLDVPPIRPEPIEQLRTPCVGGPWNGATITHVLGDYADRHTNGGKYGYQGARNPGPGATWVWHKFIDGDGSA